MLVCAYFMSSVDVMDLMQRNVKLPFWQKALPTCWFALTLCHQLMCWCMIIGLDATESHHKTIAHSSRRLTTDQPRPFEMSSNTTSLRWIPYRGPVKFLHVMAHTRCTYYEKSYCGFPVSHKLMGFS